MPNTVIKMATNSSVGQLYEVSGCRNPNATNPNDLRQYMYWVENTNNGVCIREVIFDSRCDYMNTTPINSPIYCYERYESFIKQGWIKMERDELQIHFPTINDATRTTPYSKWHPLRIVFKFLYCMNI